MSLVRLTSCPATTFNRFFSLIYRSPKNYTLCSHRVLYDRVLVSRKLSQKAEVIGPEVTIKTHIDGSRPKFIVTYDELSSQLSKGTVQLFDVRSGDDVESTGRIPGSVNIPLTDLKKALILSDSEFLQKYGVSKPKTSDNNIIFYGLSDVSSASACEIAHSMGYKRAKYYLNGWTEWSAMHKK
ncbi:unnamed protein product [Schistosoma intercalatum]|nr:unnamed protein product [Schistosoma intercalatum]CAH8451543.1 unnamed protein product [Schistosoma intercalatum]